VTGPRLVPPDDAALVRLIVAGSQDALAALYDRHAPGLHALALRLSADRGVAEEVVQETFLVLWDRAERFDPAVGSLATWLRTIARNRVLDRFRRASRRPRVVGLEPTDRGPEAGATAEPVGELVAAGDPGPDPEESAEAAERRATIAAALTELPETERTVILLAYREELTQIEIAERLGWPLGTVKTRTRRALRRLREALGEELGPDDRAPGPGGEGPGPGAAEGIEAASTTTGQGSD
jgi:RNA polymerase sigma factor (sigma-70 family)